MFFFVATDYVVAMCVTFPAGQFFMT